MTKKLTKIVVFFKLNSPRVECAKLSMHGNFNCADFRVRYIPIWLYYEKCILNMHSTC